MNLITNARDAMPNAGLIEVTAGTRAWTGAEDDLPAGRYVVLSVADSGGGIPPEPIERVLEPFFTTKEIGKGTGLRLSMVYGFAKRSGGTMRIRSELGTSPTVEIWLPSAEPRCNEHRDAAPARADAGDDAIPPLRILLVDDHHGVRATTAALLEDLGHRIVEADNADDALDLLSRGPADFDLVVSHYAMPRVSGTEMLSRAREFAPELPGIITGYADASSVAQRPVDMIVLGKSFTPDQLTTAIAAAIGR